MAPPNVITTGHNDDGLSIYVPGPQYKAYNPLIGLLYSTDSTEPVDLNNNQDIYAFEARDHTGMMSKQLDIMVIQDWPPGAGGRDGMHRTQTVDRGVLIQGELEVHLDSGEKRLMKQGDVLLQRGTNHYWFNPSKTETARMIFFVSPAKPIEGVKG